MQEEQTKTRSVFHTRLDDSVLYEACFGYKERRSNTIFYFVLMILFVFVVGFRFYWTENFGGVTVSGRSMYATLYDKEQLLMKYVDGEDARRGDIIVVYVGDYPEFKQINDTLPKDKQTKFLIKRLIAVEYDRVKCEDGQIYIQYEGKGEWVALHEPYARYTDRERYDFSEYELQKGEVFSLGDNRNDSVDSRYREENGSRLKDRLYKASDIKGVVPQWAVTNQKILEKILFWNTK